uniref:Uncharacterized protein n=1 Tax=Rhabditophanes sp. KR3021 TaxID=114890 RepID=A0AC35TWM8_9BILA
MLVIFGVWVYIGVSLFLLTHLTCCGNPKKKKSANPEIVLKEKEKSGLKNLVKSGAKARHVQKSNKQKKIKYPPVAENLNTCLISESVAEKKPTDGQKGASTKAPAAHPKLFPDLELQVTQSESAQIEPAAVAFALGEQPTQRTEQSATGESKGGKMDTFTQTIQGEVKSSIESQMLYEEAKALVDKPAVEDADTRKGVKVGTLVLMPVTDAWVCNSQSCKEK